eukprot:CAMPEP_0182495796 /NCGR_PEP_ID=MMETSP1321-20130603/4535_1 /TAXON_ID=91990 /ORGANISM="Bolidomonas sp., Strain RCC1657" /LENGTH=91 /DNA_ID=CAMNT_0024699249 /DNA_START=222 /DNA_END=497 /DNA_ORIENTATION=-
MSALEEKFLLLSARLEAQESATEKLSRALEQVKADAAESKRALEEKIKQQEEKIEELDDDISGLREDLELNQFGFAEMVLNLHKHNIVQFI